MPIDSQKLDDAEPSHPILRPERTLAIVLGASEWPFYPEFHGAPSFRRSAHDVADYMRDRDGLNLPPRNVKVLIDAFDDGPEILRQMWEFVRGRRVDLNKLGAPATDLLLYYVGHGGFADNDAFFLSIRSTNEYDPLATSITAESLGRLIREAAAGLRTYLLLDCCFAASVSKVFMNGPLGVAEAQLRDLLPQQGDDAARRIGDLPAFGTALLCASGPREPAKAPPGLPHTMFTGGLLEVLRGGDRNAPPWLSLEDTARLVRARLEARFANAAVLPAVHAPQQSLGRLDLLPLFPNPARGAPERLLVRASSKLEPSNLEPASSMEPERTVGNRAAVETAVSRTDPPRADATPRSPHLRHDPIPWLARRMLRAWAVAFTLTVAVFVWISFDLNTLSDRVYERMLGSQLAHFPDIQRATPLPPPPSDSAPRGK